MPEIWHYVFRRSHFAEGLLCAGCLQINDSSSTMSRTLTPKRPKLKGIAAQCPQRSSLKVRQKPASFVRVVSLLKIQIRFPVPNVIENLISLLTISQFRHLTGTWRRNFKEYRGVHCHNIYAVYAVYALYALYAMLKLLLVAAGVPDAMTICDLPTLPLRCWAWHLL